MPRKGAQGAAAGRDEIEQIAIHRGVLLDTVSENLLNYLQLTVIQARYPSDHPKLAPATT